MRWFRFAGAVVLLLLVSAMPDSGAAADGTGAWLDAGEPEPWNTPGANLPLPTPSDIPIDPRFTTRARPPEAFEESALVKAGWHLFAASQSGWGVRIVQATSFYDGMGRPWQYQAFVFVDGSLAGTLSPDPMNSRTDGALDQVTLTGENTLHTKFRRYGSKDPLCCPSSSASVEYRIDRGVDGPVVLPVKTTRPQATASLLDESTLKNGSYELPELGTLRLRDGRYERAYGEGATQVSRVTYLLAATGHLDGDGVEDAAAALAVDSGGSGTFVYLMAMHNQNGIAQHVGARFLGDRVRVQGLSIAEGRIVAHLRTFAPSDPLCCPSLEVTRSYRMETALAELP